MIKHWVLAIAVIFVLPGASRAQVKVLMSGGFAATYQEILPDLEKTTGLTVTTMRGRSQGTEPDTIAAQLRRGVAADVLIMSREGLDDLIKEGKIVPGTDVDVAKTSLAMAVRAGAPKPDIRTVDAFKQTLLRAKSITVVSTTGIYLTRTLFPKLGVAKEISSKLTIAGLANVLSGQSEITIQPESELHIPGVDIVGLIPKEIQYFSVFSAAIVKGSTEAEASRRLIAFLVSESARTAIARSGMEPVKSR